MATWTLWISGLLRIAWSAERWRHAEHGNYGQDLRVFLGFRVVFRVYGLGFQGLGFRVAFRV